MTRISVVIPVFNRASELQKALISVTTQSYPAEEILVVDDGSDVAVETEFSSQFPGVRFIRQRNLGVSAARNNGIKKAGGDWIAFLDSDDEWLPHKLEAQVQALKNSPESRVCHSDEIWIRNGVRVNPMKKHKKSGGDIFLQCLPLCAMSPSSVLIHKDIFAEVGVFDETLPACEDYDLWLRICSRYNVLYVDQALLKKYGGHDDQLSRKYAGMDRFRIHALLKLLQNGVLNTEQEQAVKNTLVEKSRIYINGAKRRNKAEEVSYYERLLADLKLGTSGRVGLE